MANALILKELITELDINVAKFERAIKCGSTTISQAIKRGSEIKLDIVEKY